MVLMGCDETHLPPCGFALALDVLPARRRGVGPVGLLSWLCY